MGRKRLNGLLPWGAVVINFWIGNSFSYVHEGDVVVLQWR